MTTLTQKNRKQRTTCLVVLYAALIVPVITFVMPAKASPVQITSTPQQMSGGFGHNVLHSASGTTNGQHLAYLDLNVGASNFYDPTTGGLSATLNLFSDSGLNNVVGTATATGSVPAANLADPADASLAGTLNWAISATGGSTLANYLASNFSPDGNNVYNINMSYLNSRFATSADGRTANSWANDELTLWGADGYDGAQYSQALLGVDIVFTTDPTASVPTPGALLLTSLGLVGLVGSRRKKVKA